MLSVPDWYGQIEMQSVGTSVAGDEFPTPGTVRSFHPGPPMQFLIEQPVLFLVRFSYESMHQSYQ